MALFKVQVGESIHQYISRVRMEKAQRLLLEGEASIQENVAEVGYRDLSGFGRAFKKHFGIPPSRMRYP